MPIVCLYFQVHQPCRLRPYSAFDIGRSDAYVDEEANRRILDRVASKCYLPANALLLELICRYEGRFRLAFSFSGVFLDQLAAQRPDVLAGFRDLAATGCVEMLGETFSHSLAFLFSQREFGDQVVLHRRRMETLFGQTPRTFRGTELLYANDLARAVEKRGYTAILAEGADRILRGKSPDRCYRPAGCKRLKLLLRNYRLSDDVAFRFSDRNWREHPLTAAKFAHWIHRLDGKQDTVNLFLDYETFGEHHWEDAGIFAFLRDMPGEILRHGAFRFATPAEAADSLEPEDTLDVPAWMSWADTERDLTAWLGNPMQRDAVRALYRLEDKARRRGGRMLSTWRLLQTSDHFYYMCTKWCSDGDVHKYFNPYASPYDAYINYMNILDDFARRLDGKEEAP